MCNIEYPAYVGVWGVVHAFWVLRRDCLVCALFAGVRGADAALFFLFPACIEVSALARFCEAYSAARDSALARCCEAYSAARRSAESVSSAAEGRESAHLVSGGLSASTRTCTRS